MPEIPHFAFLPAFLGKRLAFWVLLGGEIKFAENHDNFQLHGDILLTEAVQKHTRRSSLEGVTN